MIGDKIEVDKVQEAIEEILLKMGLMLDESRIRMSMGITREDEAVIAIENGIGIVREEFEKIFREKKEFGK